MLRRPLIAADIDPVAVEVAKANGKANGAGPYVRWAVCAGLRHPLIAGRAPYDLIFANILAGPLKRLAPSIARAIGPAGDVILSGLLQQDVPGLSRPIAPWGLSWPGGASLTVGSRSQCDATGGISPAPPPDPQVLAVEAKAMLAMHFATQFVRLLNCVGNFLQELRSLGGKQFHEQQGEHSGSREKLGDGVDLDGASGFAIVEAIQLQFRRAPGLAPGGERSHDLPPAAGLS